MRKLIPSVPTTYPTYQPFTTPPVGNQTYLDAVAWAQQILGWPFSDVDLDSVEARGFREGEDIEWHAAAILRHWNFVQVSWTGKSIVIRGRAQTKKSLTKELDRLISKAQVLVDPHSRRSHKAGQGRGKQLTAGRAEVWAEWQVAAGKIWKKQPKWGKLAVAKKVQEKFPDTTVETVRKHINKPTP